MDKILITGGAGYIGSQITWSMTDSNISAVVYDNLSTGHPDLIPSFVPLIVADVRDVNKLRAALIQFEITTVIHCAASSIVPESVDNPIEYWVNNVGGISAVIYAIQGTAVTNVIFSSTGAVYAKSAIPFVEDYPCKPSNPYGETKLAGEQLLRAADIKWVIFRYFNAAGADSHLRTGECHNPETHLIPKLISAAVRRDGGPRFCIYGKDYDTDDGTCIRDYIHTRDIATAHLAALKYLRDGGQSRVFNLGSGRGYSIRDVLDTTCRVIGTSIPYTIGPRRPGDPPSLIADVSLAKRLLYWKPQFSTLENIILSAYKWHIRESKNDL